GSRTRVRWPPPGRPHRLPQLHISPVALDLARGDPSPRAGGLALIAARGQRVRILPGTRQDRRRLFPGISFSLERGGALPLCAAALGVGVAGDRDRAGFTDLRADASSLPIATGALEPRGDGSRNSLGPARLLDHLESAGRQRITRERVDPVSSVA